MRKGGSALKRMLTGRVTVTIAVLIAVSLTLAFVRMRELDWDLEFLLPETVFDVDLADVATLAPTNNVQSTADEITALSRTLLPADRRLADFLRASFDRVQGLGFKPFKGTTDALTALRLGEASRNGRARLFAALLRAQGWCSSRRRRRPRISGSRSAGTGCRWIPPITITPRSVQLPRPL